MNKKIVRNIFSYSIANILSKVVVFLFNAIAARYYGSSTFGEYNYAVSIVSYFIMFANMGIQSYAVYKISKDPDEYDEIFSSVVSSELFLGIISSVALVGYVIIFPVNAIMVLIVGSTILISALDISWLFQAKQETQYVALQIIFNSVVSLLLLVLLVLIGYKNIYALPVIVSLTQLFSYTFTWINAVTEIDIKFKFTLKNLIKNIRKGSPFLFSGVFAAINCNIDVIFLTMMTSNHIVGVYSAIYKIINLIIMIVAYIVAPVFPEMIRLHTEKSYDQLNELIVKLWKPLFLFIFPVFVGGMILGEKVILFLYGADYHGGDIAFKILLIYCLIFYIREIYGYSLTMVGKQSVYMLIVFASCIINITLNLILIPEFGINGAAFTTLISEIVNLILMRFFSKKYVSLRVNIPLWKYILPACIMGIITWLLSKLNFNLIIIIIVSVITYSLAVYFSVRNDVDEFIKNRLRRR